MLPATYLKYTVKSGTQQADIKELAVMKSDSIVALCRLRSAPYEYAPGYTCKGQYLYHHYTKGNQK